MMRPPVRLLTAGLAFSAALSASALAQEAQPSHPPVETPPLLNWSFAGFFGTFDEAQLQRGFQVYREVCSNCHSMNYVAFRMLGQGGGPHFSAEEVAALAAEYQVTDGPDDAGDMFQRPGKPSDYLPAPFANEQAAKAANGGAAPPDLSVMAKARGAPRGVLWGLLDFFTAYQEGGVDYVHALLTGFADPPACAAGASGNYNKYFTVGGVPEGCKVNGVSTIVGSFIAMPPPLADGQVTYADGTAETTDQYARDVAAFLMWTAEPHLVERKRTGFQVIIFLAVFAVLMYLTKRKVWAEVAH